MMMNFARMLILTAISLVSLVACAGIRTVKYPLPQTASGKISVTNGVIYADDRPYAEMICHFPIESSENKKAYLKLGYFTSCRGLSIHYIIDNNEVWIFPKDGIPPNDLMKSHHTKESKDHTKESKDHTKESKIEEIVTGAYDINLSEDGRLIRYKTPVVFWNSEHVFFVESGTSE
jgi:hypothetical protein